MRNLITRLTVGLVCVVLCAWGVVWRYRSDTEQKRELALAVAREQQTLQRTEQAIARIVAARDAVTDWTDTFGGERFTERFSGQDLAPVLARKDGRPVLVFGSVLDVITRDNGCTLEFDAKANLVSNIRFWLECTSAQAREVLRHREEDQKEALEEIREDAGEKVGEETPEDKREAERKAARRYALIAQVDTAGSEVLATAADPQVKAQFIFARGRCLELLYVGDYVSPGKEAYLRLTSSEMRHVRANK